MVDWLLPSTFAHGGAWCPVVEGVKGVAVSSGARTGLAFNPFITVIFEQGTQPSSSVLSAVTCNTGLTMPPLGAVV